MRPIPVLLTLLLLTLVSTCATRNDDPEASGVDTLPETGVDLTPNDGNTDIYDVDPDDPYLVSNGIFLGLKPGEPLGAYADALRKGRLRTGEGTFDVLFVDGAEGNELGYVLPDPRDKTKIGDIHITSPAVVTEAGVRIGLTYEELIERLGPIDFHGSEVEGRVYGQKHGLSYRLSMTSNRRNLQEADIDPDATLTEIVIDRRG